MSFFKRQKPEIEKEPVKKVSIHDAIINAIGQTRETSGIVDIPLPMGTDATIELKRRNTLGIIYLGKAFKCKRLVIFNTAYLQQGNGDVKNGRWGIVEVPFTNEEMNSGIISDLLPEKERLVTRSFFIKPDEEIHRDAHIGVTVSKDNSLVTVHQYTDTRTVVSQEMGAVVTLLSDKT